MKKIGIITIAAAAAALAGCNRETAVAVSTDAGFRTFTLREGAGAANGF